MQRRFISLLVSSLLGLTASAAFAAPVELNVSAWKGGAAEPAAVPELIAKFEKENPDIKIKFDYIARNDTTTILSSRLQGGSAPDVMMVDRPLMRQWASAGQLMDLSGDAGVGRLTPDVKPLAQIGGKYYMMPMEIVGIGMFANLDLLKKAGVEHVPANIEELKASCGKLRAAGITPLLLPAKDGWAPAMFALSMGLAPSVKANPAFVSDVVAGKQKFAANQNFKLAITSLKELADAKCFDPKLNVGIDPWGLGLTEFTAGRVAMMPQGAWSIQKMSSDGKAINFAFAPLPGLNGGKPNGIDLLGTAWAINAATKNAAAAKRWVQFWTKDENLGKFLQADAAFSPFTDGANRLPKSAQLYIDARKAGNTVPHPKGDVSAAFIQEMQKSMTAYLLNINQDSTTVLARWDNAPQQQ
uniref:ABC transporter substrate-binding protein n=1 Tax=Cupriavidus necator TaxID=106590 RepID=UPI003F4963F4